MTTRTKIQGAGGATRPTTDYGRKAFAALTPDEKAKVAERSIALTCRLSVKDAWTLAIRELYEEQTPDRPTRPARYVVTVPSLIFYRIGVVSDELNLALASGKTYKAGSGYCYRVSLTVPMCAELEGEVQRIRKANHDGDQEKPVEWAAARVIARLRQAQGQVA